MTEPYPIECLRFYMTQNPIAARAGNNRIKKGTRLRRWALVRSFAYVKKNPATKLQVTIAQVTQIQMNGMGGINIQDGIQNQIQKSNSNFCFEVLLCAVLSSTSNK